MADREVTDQSLFITIRVLLVFVLWLPVRALDQCSDKNTKHKTIDPSQPDPAPPPRPTGIGAFNTRTLEKKSKKKVIKDKR